MVDEPYQFQSGAHGSQAKPPLRFEAGSPNTLGQAALHASVGLLQDVGMSTWKLI